MNIKRTDDSRYKTGNQNQKYYFSVSHDLTLRVRTIKTFYSLVVLAASRPALLATLAGVRTQCAVGCGRPCRFATRTPRNPRGGMDSIRGRLRSSLPLRGPHSSQSSREVWTQYAVGCGRPCRFAARTPRNPRGL